MAIPTPPRNTYNSPQGKRYCRTCHRKHALAHQARKAQLPVEQHPPQGRLDPPGPGRPSRVWGRVAEDLDDGRGGARRPHARFESKFESKLGERLAKVLVIQAFPSVFHVLYREIACRGERTEGERI